MALQQFLVNQLGSLTFDFFSGASPTSVDDAALYLYTPERSPFAVGVTLGVTAVAGVTGRYQYTLPITAGMTPGTWFGFMSGLTNGASLLSLKQTFDIVDYSAEPLWLSVEEFRAYIEEPDDEHQYDRLFALFVTGAMELVETYTRRKWGLTRYVKTFRLEEVSQLLLPAYPVNSLASLTLVGGTLGYQLDAANGVLYLTDAAGAPACTGAGAVVTVDWIAGSPRIKQNIRLAALYIASKLNNVRMNEGLDNVRIGDMNFAQRHGLFDEIVKDLLQHDIARTWT